MRIASERGSSACRKVESRSVLVFYSLMEPQACTRREFLRRTSTMAVAAPLGASLADRLFAADTPAAGVRGHSDAKVAIARCRSYGPELRTGLQECFDLIGGIG